MKAASPDSFTAASGCRPKTNARLWLVPLLALSLLTPAVAKPAVNLPGDEALTALAQPGSFVDLGIAAPLVRMTSAFSTINKAGERLVVFGYARGILVVNIDRNEQINYQDPDIDTERLGGFCYFLSSANRYYLSRDRCLLELDVETGNWSPIIETPTRAAMSFTEGPDGTIYLALYPNAELLAYDPETGEITELVRLHESDWPCYVSAMAVGDDGWLYATIGYQESTVVAFHLKERKLVDLFDEHWTGATRLFTAAEGSIITTPVKRATSYRLSDGRAEAVIRTPKPDPNPKFQMARTREIFTSFGDGSEITSLAFEDRLMTVQLAGESEPRTITLDYPQPVDKDYPHPNGGRLIYSICLGTNGNIYGSTGLPLRFFEYKRKERSFQHWGSNLKIANGHMNSLTADGEIIYGAIYSGGYLTAFDTGKPWKDPYTPTGNPRLLTQRQPINRPHALVLNAHSQLVMGGTPGYGRRGAGLSLHDLTSGETTIIPEEHLVPDQATFSLAVMPDGDIIGGTTIAPGTGGTAAEGEAHLYRLDPRSRTLKSMTIPVPGAIEITDLLPGEGGRIHGLARLTSDRERWGARDIGTAVFFTVDPETMKVLHHQDLSTYGPPAGVMAPQVLHPLGNGGILALFRNAIVQINPETGAHRRIATPPEAIGEGVILAGNDLVFSVGGRLMAYGLPHDLPLP